MAMVRTALFPFMLIQMNEEKNHNRYKQKAVAKKKITGCQYILKITGIG
jgi:hypothetical protein